MNPLLAGARPGLNFQQAAIPVLIVDTAGGHVAAIPRDGLRIEGDCGIHRIRICCHTTAGRMDHRPDAVR